MLVADVAVFFSAVFAYTACVLFRGKSDMVRQVSGIVLIHHHFCQGSHWVFSRWFFTTVRVLAGSLADGFAPFG